MRISDWSSERVLFRSDRGLAASFRLRIPQGRPHVRPDRHRRPRLPLVLATAAGRGAPARSARRRLGDREGDAPGALPGPQAGPRIPRGRQRHPTAAGRRHPRDPARARAGLPPAPTPPRTFALIVIVDHGYRWFWRRLQGEARLLDPPDDGSATGKETRPERFLVRKLGREFLVAASDIEWLQAAGNYVNLRVRGRDYPLRSTIAGIAAQLDPDRFVRIHRSYIVNLDTVASIEPLDSGDARVHLQDGTALPCSRRHRDELRADRKSTRLNSSH